MQAFLKVSQFCSKQDPPIGPLSCVIQFGQIGQFEQIGKICQFFNFAFLAATAAQVVIVSVRACVRACVYQMLQSAFWMPRGCLEGV